MSAPQNLRDLVNRFVPSWLSDKSPDSPSWGFRVLWGIVLIIDGALELVAQASLAAVGRGTPTALPYVGQARGMIQNQDESDADFADRLGTWVDRAKENGGPTRLILAIHDYLRSHPRIRLYKRNGDCITVETDREVTYDEGTAWDWDSESHPERATWWSDVWIVVYTTSGSPDQWVQRPGALGDLGDDGFAWGHLASKKEVDDIKGLVQLCKAAHTCVRAIVWTNDETKFVPSTPASMPNGRWGAWGIYDGDDYVASDRDLTTCRFWEPR